MPKSLALVMATVFWLRMASPDGIHSCEAHDFDPLQRRFERAVSFDQPAP